MLGLPESTKFNKRIPKQRFYENPFITPAVKRMFTEQVQMIYWFNKLSADTLNIAPGKQVTEIEVIVIKLASPDLDENVLRLIDRAIPYHILFLLERNGKHRAAMGYKEVSTGDKTAVHVGRYYYTDWMDAAELPLHLEGLTMDAVYEHFIRQIAGTSLIYGESITLKESVEQQKQREIIEKQIAALQARIKKEKQPKKKFELVRELKKIRERMKK